MTNQDHVIRTSLEGSIGRLTFDNPAKYNALNQASWLAIPKALQELETLGARAIIVSGSEGNFCAGADISEFDSVRKNAETARIYEKANADAFAALGNVGIPTIAQIEGFCLGGGFGLASACDLRIASPEATFSLPPARLGLAYPVEAMADIVAAVGEQTAKYLVYSAARVDAEKMQSFGFLFDVVAKDDLEGRIDDLAHQIASLAPLTHKASKAAIKATRLGDTHIAKKLGDATFASEDYVEGRRAFQEKRSPVFNGR